jgi:cytochrome P450
MAKIAPGPRGHILWGSLPERRKEPLKLYMNSVLEYGDVVRFRFGPVALHLIARPEHVKQVLQDNHRNYSKGYSYRMLEPLLGQGLLTSEGEHWRRQRKLAQPAFHRQRLEGFAEIMAREAEAMASKWQPGEELDVAQEMMRLTLAVVCKTLLGVDIGGQEIGPAITRLLEEFNNRILSIFRMTPAFSWLPSPGKRRAALDIRTLDRVVYGMIEARRRSGEAEHHDLLSMLMQARDEETGETMDDKALRDEVMTIFLAGHETTATALTWTFYLLSKHPDQERRVREELARVLGGRRPAFADYPRLTYTTQVIEEALRLYPPVWVLAREALAEDEIGGYRIPKGSIVVICPYVTHHHPALWENPEGFDPERFAPGAEESRPKYAYFPFGGGPRLCIGNNFAMMEAVLVLATVLQSRKLELAAGFVPEPDPLITFRSKNGMRMRMRPAPLTARPETPAPSPSA